MTSNQVKHKTTLVLSGCGVKLTAHIGALQALDEHKLLDHIDTISATSAGGIIGFMMIIGLTVEEIKLFLMNLDFSKLQNPKPFHVLDTFGFDDCRKMIIVFEKLCERKNIDKNITFEELYQQTGKRLILTGSCLNDQKLYYFSIDHTPDMKIIQALRISISVPIWFYPVEHDGKLFVDGGLMNNYPIEEFMNNLDTVIGIYVNEKTEYLEKITNIEEFLALLIKCSSQGVTCKTVENCTQSTIIINTPHILTINFNIDQNTKQQLYECGYAAGSDFVKTLVDTNNGEEISEHSSVEIVNYDGV